MLVAYYRNIELPWGISNVYIYINDLRAKSASNSMFIKHSEVSITLLGIAVRQSSNDTLGYTV